ncbi:YhcH/YjgK/YiaL family protein [Telmatospirillum siberiense]|uniref:YhcH/YjgK/YiaL family protein n=1 Tax=Telmatospirillum siberiense TaxID=382514 RepID=A0A2N3PZD8_9PROT|nr:YhcH/YjgK/YiaL family protein [Telmatospirillum siberiense]PKU25758.1 YhcH/YjgK/YiaL family protein [Telmatospirillum siberiense]
MIFGNMNSAPEMLAWLPAGLRTAVSYLMGGDFDTRPAGRYDLAGDDIFVLVQDVTTKPKLEQKPEVHRRYIDVQFVVKGREAIGVAVDTGKNKVREDLLTERDVLFYEAMDDESTLVLKPGNFVILFPSDVHRPVCQVDGPEAVRKVVVKVKVDG